MKATNSDNSKVYPASLQPGAEVGSWRIVDTLGVGGYGVVYRVELPEAPGRFFALKLSLHSDPGRTLREISLLMDKAQHPNVVRIHASGRWPDPVTGFPYFVMDLIDGPALHTWADTFNPTFRQLAFAGGYVALALDLLHIRGVVHRDLKPEHILICVPEFMPVLIDFGASDHIGAPTLTTAALPPGTHHLRSPEAIRFLQLHGRRTDARYPYRDADDLYALGVCLYRAATGHFPFPPTLPPELLSIAIVTRPPPPPQSINPRVPAPLANAILKLLEKDPEQRTRNGTVAYEDLVEGMLSNDSEDYDSRLFDEEKVQPDRDAPPALRVRRPEWPSRAYPSPSELKSTLVRLLPAFVIGLFMRWHDRRNRRRGTPPPTPKKEGPHAIPPPQKPRSRARTVGLGLLLTLLVGGLAAWAALARAGARDTTGEVPQEKTTSAGQKMASAPEPTHTTRAAVPPPVGPTPAAVAPLATHSEEPAPVTRNPTSSAPAPQPPKQDSNALRRAVKTAALATCTGLAACASTPPLADRATPPSEPCPEESIKARKSQFKLAEGDQFVVTFDPENKRGLITVREGRAAVYSVSSFGSGRVPLETKFLGTVYVTDQRIYGRFTEARTPQGAIVPVCFEIWSNKADDKERGFSREPGGDATSAVISSQVSFRAVNRFE